jgi:predicted amidophosphoribosyltransferase
MNKLGSNRANRSNRSNQDNICKNCKSRFELLTNGLCNSCLAVSSKDVIEKLSKKELELAQEALQELKNSPIVEIRHGFPSTAYHDRKEYKERHNNKK